MSLPALAKTTIVTFCFVPADRGWGDAPRHDCQGQTQHIDRSGDSDATWGRGGKC